MKLSLDFHGTFDPKQGNSATVWQMSRCTSRKSDPTVSRSIAGSDAFGTSFSEWEMSGPSAFGCLMNSGKN